jgi:ABC-type polysaccharide/polyol phosphate export permease
MKVLLLLWRYRALVMVLVRRELAARYRASLFGYLWSLLNPLLLLAVYAVVFTTIFTPRFPGGDPYPLFLFTGLLPWLFLSGAVLDSALTLVDNGPLLAKVMCPPEIFPAVTVLSHLVHHLLAVPVLVAALGISAWLGWHPFPLSVWALPVALVPWVLVTGGLSLAVAALAVYLRDLRDLLGHVLNLVFFSSPIIYSLDGLELPDLLETALRCNPMAYVVGVYRSVTFAGDLGGVREWALALGFGLAMWWLGVAIFGRLRETVVEAV